MWASCRNLGLDEIEKRIKNGDEYIIRFRSEGNAERKIKHHDVVKGNIDFPENDQDIVLIKSDGLPTYHFAHVVDDYLMRTTHVIRGDEWLSSLPVHIQLFQALGVKLPKYAHVAPIMKEDNGKKRKTEMGWRKWGGRARNRKRPCPLKKLFKISLAFGKI